MAGMRGSRLAERQGSAVVDDAMLELELQPLHDALRAGDEQAALAEVGGAPRYRAPARAPPAPEVELREATADERTLAARDRDSSSRRNKPDMARGKWIYDWLSTACGAMPT